MLSVQPLLFIYHSLSFCLAFFLFHEKLSQLFLKPFHSSSSPSFPPPTSVCHIFFIVFYCFLQQDTFFSLSFIYNQTFYLSPVKLFTLLPFLYLSFFLFPFLTLSFLSSFLCRSSSSFFKTISLLFLKLLTLFLFLFLFFYFFPFLPLSFLSSFLYRSSSSFFFFFFL